MNVSNLNIRLNRFFLLLSHCRGHVHTKRLTLNVRSLWWMWLVWLSSLISHFMKLSHLLHHVTSRPVFVLSCMFTVAPFLLELINLLSTWVCVFSLSELSCRLCFPYVTHQSVHTVTWASPLFLDSASACSPSVCRPPALSTISVFFSSFLPESGLEFLLCVSTLVFYNWVLLWVCQKGLASSYLTQLSSQSRMHVVCFSS